MAALLSLMLWVAAYVGTPNHIVACTGMLPWHGWCWGLYTEHVSIKE